MPASPPVKPPVPALTAAALDDDAAPAGVRRKVFETVLMQALPLPASRQEFERMTMTHHAPPRPPTAPPLPPAETPPRPSTAPPRSPTAPPLPPQPPPPSPPPPAPAPRRRGASTPPEPPAPAATAAAAEVPVALLPTERVPAIK